MMRQGMRCLVAGCCLLATVDAAADESTPPAAAGSFLPFAANHVPADKPVVSASPLKTQHFFPLGPLNYRTGMPVRPAASVAKPEEISLEDVAMHSTAPHEGGHLSASHGTMSSEQAQQIIYLFSPNQ